MDNNEMLDLLYGSNVKQNNKDDCDFIRDLLDRMNYKGDFVLEKEGNVLTVTTLSDDELNLSGISINPSIYPLKEKEK